MTDGYASVRPLYGLWRLFWSKNLMGHGKSRKRNRESFFLLMIANGEKKKKTGEQKIPGKNVWIMRQKPY